MGLKLLLTAEMVEVKAAIRSLRSEASCAEPGTKKSFNLGGAVAKQSLAMEAVVRDDHGAPQHAAS